MKNSLLCLLVLTAAVGAPTHALAAENEPPVVDAGLDQSVVRGSTVYLDAGGSYDPDGEIRSYEWTILTPNGTRISPDCPVCERTSFVPTQSGTYEVTVVVTDDDGATTSDTLYVDVSDGAGPSVTLSAANATSDSDPLEVTATARSGAAPLDRIEWFVDGERVGVDDASGDRARAVRRLPTNRSEPLTITAVVVDRADQRAVATTDVRPDGSGSTAPGENGTENSSKDGVGEIVDRIYVSGPSLLTGAEPLTGEYELLLEGRNVSVRSIEWRLDGRVVDTGRTAKLALSPGNHTLEAFVITKEGIHTVGFRDGSRTVVADPRPNVSFDAVAVDGTRVTGNVTATDGYGNLKRVSLTVDDRRVATAPGTAISVRHHDSLRTGLDRSLAANTSYVLAAIAVDHRGQSHTVTRSVTTGSGTDSETSDPPPDTGPGTDPEPEPDPDPTVVSSAFVDGPVDSYHDRIDPDRYLAEHVTRIDLDGADPAAVDVVFNNRDDDVRNFDQRVEKRYDEESDVLIIRSYLAGDSPGVYETSFVLTIDGQQTETFSSTFEVTPSDPEPRLDVRRAGTEYDSGEWGMVVDASDSFDPDGSEIEYEWNGETEELSTSGVAKLNSRGRASLTIHTQDGRSTTVEGAFLDYFNPGLDTVERTTVDRITEEGTVFVRIRTPVYAFSKNTYDVDLNVEVVGDGRVVEWKNIERSADGGDGSGSAETDLEQWYTGVVAIERDELGDGPDIRIYNDAEPSVTAVTYSVPEESESTVTYARRNITVQSVRYEVNDTAPEIVETASPDERDEYLEAGFEVRETYQEDVEYLLERRTTVTVPSTEQKTFDTRQTRRLFLSTHPEWSTAGTVTESETETVTVTVWRDERGGPGEFTGETRRQIEDGSRTVTEMEFVKTTTRTVEVTEQRTVYTPEGSREITVTVQKTVEREQTYWAVVPESSHHRRTGRTRETPVDGTTTTEYEYRVERTRERQVERFVAERSGTESVVRWQSWKRVDATFETLRDVRSQDDVRIGDAVQQTNWRLVREHTGTRIQDHYERASAVNKTIVYVSGELIRNDLENGSTEVVDEFQTRLTFEGALSEEEVVQRIAEREGETPCSDEDPITPGCDDYKDDD